MVLCGCLCRIFTLCVFCNLSVLPLWETWHCWDVFDSGCSTTAAPHAPSHLLSSCCLFLQSKPSILLSTRLSEKSASLFQTNSDCGVLKVQTITMENRKCSLRLQLWGLAEMERKLKQIGILKHVGYKETKKIVLLKHKIAICIKAVTFFSWEFFLEVQFYITK